MKLATLLLLSAVAALASPPTCKNKTVDGTTFEICSRADASCFPTVTKFLEEKSDDWKKNWNGCNWNATFYKSASDPLKLGPVGYMVSLSLVASYRDSEKMDVTILLEWKDGTVHKIERKNVPVVIKADVDLPTVDIEFLLPYPDPSIGVPTVESTERGGERSFSHSYK